MADPGQHVHVTAHLPKQLVGRLDAEARRRLVGRRLLIEWLLTDGVSRLEDVDNPAITPPAPDDPTGAP